MERAPLGMKASGRDTLADRLPMTRTKVCPIQISRLKGGSHWRLPESLPAQKAATNKKDKGPPPAALDLIGTRFGASVSCPLA